MYQSNQRPSFLPFRENCADSHLTEFSLGLKEHYSHETVPQIAPDSHYYKVMSVDSGGLEDILAFAKSGGIDQLTMLEICLDFGDDLEAFYDELLPQLNSLKALTLSSIDYANDSEMFETLSNLEYLHCLSVKMDCVRLPFLKQLIGVYMGPLDALITCSFPALETLELDKETDVQQMNKLLPTIDKLRHITLRDESPELTTLHTAKFPQQVISLQFHGVSSHEQFSRLCAAPVMQQLEYLTIIDCLQYMTPSEINTTSLPKLNYLVLTHRLIRFNIVEITNDLKHEGLTHLDVANCKSEDEDIETLLNSDICQQLRYLRIPESCKASGILDRYPHEFDGGYWLKLK